MILQFYNYFLRRIGCLALVWLLAGAPLFAASTKTWRTYRDNGRGAVRQNDFNYAAEQYLLAFQEAEAAFKGTDLRYLETAAEAGQLHVQLRRFDKAIEIFTTALRRLEKPKGDETLFKAAFQTALGSAYMYARKLDIAEETLKAAAKYVEEKVGYRHPLLAQALEGLGSVYLEKGQPDKALPVLERALEIARTPMAGAFTGGYATQRAMGLPAEAEILNTIGILHLSQSNYVAAEKSLKEALNTIGRYQGNNSVSTAAILRNLSSAYKGQGEFQEAEDTLIRLMVLGEDLAGSGLVLAQAAGLMAELHFAQNDSAVERLFKRMASGKSGEPNPRNFAEYFDVMAGYYARRDWGRTIEFIRKAQSGAPESAAHILTAGAKHARAQKKPADAIALLQDCVRELEKTHGPRGAALLNPVKEIADIQAEEGRFEDAERSYDELIAVARNAFGPTDSRVANAIDDKANLMGKVGKQETAADLRAEANRVRAAALSR